MKKTLLVLLTVLLTFAMLVPAVAADDVITVSDAASVDASETVSDNAVKEDDAEDSKDDMGVELNFQADGFTRNLKYMGLGMLGIFVVVGVVILITFALNSATGKKK